MEKVAAGTKRQEVLKIQIYYKLRDPKIEQKGKKSYPYIAISVKHFYS